WSASPSARNAASLARSTATTSAWRRRSPSSAASSRWHGRCGAETRSERVTRRSVPPEAEPSRLDHLLRDRTGLTLARLQTDRGVSLIGDIRAELDHARSQGFRTPDGCRETAVQEVMSAAADLEGILGFHRLEPGDHGLGVVAIVDAVEADGKQRR